MISKKVMTYQKSELVERISSIYIQTDKSIDELDCSFLFDYRIFPSNILTAKTQWQTENRGPQVGDTIVQQAFLPPSKWLSQKIIFGVRISEIINDENLKRLSYETLEGHVERGHSSFSVTADEGSLKFSIHTFSEPGNLLMRLLGPFVTLPYQAYCTRQALIYVKKQLELQ